MRYTHLKQNGVFVEIGNNIVAGQPLALSGSSGNTGGNPHLHLQAFRDDSSYNGFNSVPINFSNTTGPVNSQNLCIVTSCYPATVIISSVNLISSAVPDKFFLNQNFPNPFNPSTVIEFSIKDLSFVQLKIYDLLGNEVAVLLKGELIPGSYKYNWNAGDLAGEVYFYRLQSEEFTETKKMVLLR